MPQRIIALIKKDPARMKALIAVKALALPHGYIAAGFIRNLVWDHLHQKSKPTPLNDLDVIYFAPGEEDEHKHVIYEAELKKRVPAFNWQVRNQAKMHLRNGDTPYSDILDAMRYWPEQETAIAVRLNDSNHIECLSAFGIESLFALKITPNPKRDIAISQQRITQKNWLATWPKLTVATLD